MKPYYLLFIAIANSSFASPVLKTDTTKKADAKTIHASIETLPEFPGGVPAFINYIGRNLKYPEVAKLIGINGKLKMTIVIDKDGKVVDAAPINCIGAGCEAEAVSVLQNSPQWKPGIQNGRSVRVQYTVPISFSIPKGNIYLNQLRKSDYGFVFNIKGTLYTIDEAEKLLGKEFPSDQVEIADPFYNGDNIEKFKMPDKKEVYLLRIKA
ncbi:energy transducer TonB [Mucilaginibacter ginsenosidivorax]|uniref:Energy transducer TonB n=1 Tax=Mucilaginibacter ginsenosidivorax TaxID=862126 RepID=A0A5B8VW50_9SPHI|nr:energy transducer TonB [Mucilaginibacter ginsenosidivorax]QEC75740.1 energy transducer TonB [Mucilaginibacter ginsenosidivorax]